jgi:superfamily I DNA/RNA helicase
VLIHRAIEQVRRNTDVPVLNRTVGFFEAEIRWISHFGVRSAQDYYTRERVGRKGTRVERSDRATVWEVYHQYLQQRALLHREYDWDDLAIAVQDELVRDNSDWLYRHIVVDEGQDFSPSMLRSLAVAIPPNGSLSVFGDVAQQIYGTRLSWKDAGLAVRKVFDFKENYRNSREISALALALANSEYYKDEPDIVIPSEVSIGGPKPTLVCCETPEAENAFVLKQAVELAKTMRIAVLFRKNAAVEQFLTNVRKCSNVRCTALHPERGVWFWELGLMAGTYQAAKGLEFDCIWMPHSDSETWPNPDRVAEIGVEDARDEDARLLYVGITRARKRLIISYAGKITELLPSDPNLYQEVEVKA